jgi:hypothetical protein
VSLGVGGGGYVSCFQEGGEEEGYVGEVFPLSTGFCVYKQGEYTRYGFMTLHA